MKTHTEELKMRPFCHAKSKQCPIGPLAKLLGIVFDPFIEAADRDNRTEVESTEELCIAIRETNEKIEKDGVPRGSFPEGWKVRSWKLGCEKLLSIH